MIGAHDVLIKLDFRQVGRLLAARLILATLRTEWPDFVVEGVSSDPRMLQGEFFVYRTAEAFRAWVEFGAVPETEDTMLHVILDDRGITFVDAGPTSATRRLTRLLTGELAKPCEAPEP